MTSDIPIPTFTPAAAPTSFFHANIDAIRQRKHTSIRWLWHGLLMPGNVTLLTSMWKSGKTTLVSVLLARLATGGALAGLSLRSGRAAVISEEAEEHWLSRDELLHFGPHIHFFTRPFRARPTLEQWQSLIDQLITMHRSDPLASFLPGHTENHASTMLEFLLPLQQLTAEGICVLVLHHPKKGETTEAQAARGSGALTGHVDIILEMKWFGRPTEDDRRRTLTGFSRHKETPRRLVVELTADGTDYLSHGDYAAPDLDSGWQVLNGVLEDADDKLTRKAILQAWPQDFPKPDEATLWRWLDRATREGKCLREGTGRKNTPFLYWLDGMEDVWNSDPYPKVKLEPVEDLLGVRRKTLQEALADRARPARRRRKQPETPTPTIVEQMSEAARLRANGVAWGAVADYLKLHEETCQDWQMIYEAQWNGLLAQARKAVQEVTKFELIQTMRNNMKSSDPKVQIKAAKAIQELNADHNSQAQERNSQIDAAIRTSMEKVRQASLS